MSAPKRTAWQEENQQSSLATRVMIEADRVIDEALRVESYMDSEGSVYYVLEEMDDE